jgi:chemotaxis protein MotB
MAVKRSFEDSKIETGSWMLTFSDMITLLLTFFVMIISITSLDPRTISVDSDEKPIEDITSIPPEGPGSLGFSNPLLMAPLVELIENQEQLPPDISLDQDALLAALFQLDPENTPDYQRLQREVSDSVSIFKDERGMVIRWDQAILFPEGTSILREDNLLLLGNLTDLLSSLSLPVSVEAHTNPLSELEGGDSSVAYRLSTRRAKIVMNYLTERGLPEGRFRLGSFGGSRPVTSDPQRGGENSRLEIVLYKPAKSSWNG